MPQAIDAWLSGRATDACALAEDVAPAFGQFAPLCGGAPRNTGIRGLPPGFDLGAALDEVLAVHPVRLVSELDEQGLQVAALSRAGPALAVTLEDVAICSPFPPHLQQLERCGAHFVGLNMRPPRTALPQAAPFPPERLEIGDTAQAPHADGAASDRRWEPWVWRERCGQPRHASPTVFLVPMFPAAGRVRPV